VSRVLLVHWHAAECAERAERLRECGFFVDTHWRQDAGTELTRSLSAEPPAAVVIDLERLPSHGRAIAAWLRERKALRSVPIVFVPGPEAKAGAAEKLARLRAAFPDAVYAAWGKLATALPKAIANPPRDPVVPKSPDYSGTPLPKKLGIKAGGRLVVVRDFVAALGELPEGVRATKRIAGVIDVVVLFCRELAELRADFAVAAGCLADHGGLWVAWPKKASGVPTDLDDGAVRAFGLDQGLVDTKVCAIDAVWSGLRFSRRRVSG